MIFELKNFGKMVTRFWSAPAKRSDDGALGVNRER